MINHGCKYDLMIEKIDQARHEAHERDKCRGVPECEECLEQGRVCQGCGGELAEYESTKTCRNCAR